MKKPPLWKLNGAGNRELEFFNFPPIMNQLKYRVSEEVNIYLLREGKWDLVFTQHQQDTCACGRKYNLFRFRDSFFDSPRTIAEQIAWLHLPLLCKFCYYKKEHARGRWIPNEVARELGLKK